MKHYVLGVLVNNGVSSSLQRVLLVSKKKPA